MIYRSLTTSIVLVFFLAGCEREAPIDDLTWPQWRGPDGAGITYESPLPVTWGPESENIRWRVEVPGRGNSSPIAAGGRVFLTTAAEPRPGSKKLEFWRTAVAYDVETGEELWMRPVARLPKGERHRRNSYAAPTPATDGKLLYVYFGSMIAALDVATGTVRWEKQLEPGHFASTRYGASSSPVLSGDKVIVVQDQEDSDGDGGWMVALDKSSGKERWRVEWDDTCCSYSTPLVVDRGSGDEIIFAHSARVVSYDAATGEELWRRDVPISQMVSTPVLAGNLLGVSGGAHNIRHTSFFELAGSGRDTQIELLWETPKFPPHTSSPVLYQQRFFAVTDNGVLTCFDARTGKLRWKRRVGPEFLPSLLAGDDKIYALASTGLMTVVQLRGKDRVLATNELGEEGSNASPAVADGCLLLRMKTSLYCIEAGTEEADAGQAES